MLWPRSYYKHWTRARKTVSRELSLWARGHVASSCVNTIGNEARERDVMVFVYVLTIVVSTWVHSPSVLAGKRSCYISGWAGNVKASWSSSRARSRPTRMCNSTPGDAHCTTCTLVIYIYDCQQACIALIFNPCQTANNGCNAVNMFLNDSALHLYCNLQICLRIPLVGCKNIIIINK